MFFVCFCFFEDGDINNFSKFLPISRNAGNDWDVLHFWSPGDSKSPVATKLVSGGGGNTQTSQATEAEDSKNKNEKVKGQTGRNGKVRLEWETKKELVIVEDCRIHNKNKTEYCMTYCYLFSDCYSVEF